MCPNQHQSPTITTLCKVLEFYIWITQGKDYSLINFPVQIKNLLIGTLRITDLEELIFPGTSHYCEKLFYKYNVSRGILYFFLKTMYSVFIFNKTLFLENLFFYKNNESDPWLKIGRKLVLFYIIRWYLYKNSYQY